MFLLKSVTVTLSVSVRDPRSLSHPSLAVAAVPSLAVCLEALILVRFHSPGGSQPSRPSLIPLTRISLCCIHLLF